MLIGTTSRKLGLPGGLLFETKPGERELHCSNQNVMESFNIQGTCRVDLEMLYPVTARQSKPTSVYMYFVCKYVCSGYQKGNTLYKLICSLTSLEAWPYYWYRWHAWSFESEHMNNIFILFRNLKRQCYLPDWWDQWDKSRKFVKKPQFTKLCKTWKMKKMRCNVGVILGYKQESV